MRVYIASSWRNAHYKDVCAAVRAAGHEVLDWRDGESLLPHWGIADERFAQATRNQQWTPQLAREALLHPNVRATHAKDMRLLNAADALVLLTPCGRSAHLEAGIAEGRDLPRALLLTADVEPELMTCSFTALTSVAELAAWLEATQARFEDRREAAERERDELCEYLLGQNIDPSMHEGVRAIVRASRERKAAEVSR